MAALSRLQITRTGATAAYVAASAGGDTVLGYGAEGYVLHVKNGGGAGITVTVNDGISPSAVAIGAGSEAFILAGPGGATVSYTGVTSVTVAVLAISP